MIHATKAALLDAARSAIAERGYHGATVDQAVAKAGFAKGAFYHHWSSKAEVLREILLTQADEQAQISEGCVAAKGTAIERLQRFITELFLHCVAHRAELKIWHSSIDMLKDPYFKGVANRTRDIQANLRRLIREGVANGEMRDIDYEALPGFIITGSCAYVFRWWPLPEVDASPEDIGKSLALMLLQGLRAPDGAPALRSPQPRS